MGVLGPHNDSAEEQFAICAETRPSEPVRVRQTVSESAIFSRYFTEAEAISQILYNKFIIIAFDTIPNSNGVT